MPWLSKCFSGRGERVCLNGLSLLHAPDFFRIYVLAFDSKMGNPDCAGFPCLGVFFGAGTEETGGKYELGFAYGTFYPAGKSEKGVYDGGCE